MRKISAFILLLFSLSILMVGCNRINSDQNSKININLPSLKFNKIISAEIAEGTEYISHIVLNISSVDLKKNIVWNWDACDDCSTIDLPPDPIQMVVPMGDNRLIQVLVVYEIEGGGMTFYYGDTTKSFSNLVENVDVIIKNIGSGSGKSATVIGKFSFDNGNGPTDNFDVVFQPPNGSPRMDIMKTAMFNGWFNFFLVDGANFGLVNSRTGNFLLKDLNFSHPQIVASEYSMHLNIPDYYRVYKDEFMSAPEINDNGNDDDLLIITSLGTSKKPVCYEEVTEDIVHYNEEMNDDGNLRWMEGLYIDETANNLLKYSTTDTTDFNKIYVISGGTQYSANSCYDTNFILEKLGFRYKYMKNGVDAAVGIRGPYQIIDPPHGSVDEYPEFVKKYYDPSTKILNLTWKYLPDVKNSLNAISGTSIYYKTNFSDKDRDLLHSGPNNIDCERVSALGFKLLKDVEGDYFNINLENLLQTTITSTTNLKEMLSDKEIVLCPYRNFSSYKQLMNGGIEAGIRHSYFPSSPLTLSHMKINVPNKMGSEQCHKINIDFYDNYGSPYFLNLDKTLDISSADLSALNFFFDGSCNNAFTNTSINIPSGSNNFAFYVKITSGQGGGYFDSHEINFNMENINYSSNIDVALTSSATRYQLNLPKILTPNECYKLELFASDDFGFPASYMAVNTIDIVSNSADLYFSTDSNCSTLSSNASIIFNSGDYDYKVIYLKLKKEFFNSVIHSHDITLNLNENITALGDISLTLNDSSKLFAAGLDFNCAVNIYNRRVKCWGNNSSGQLGLEHTMNMGDELNEMGINLPYLNLGNDINGYPLRVKQISAGSYHTCALFENDKIKCWGRNYEGQLGNGSVGNIYGDSVDEMGDFLPYVFADISSFKYISAGSKHNCAVTYSDQVKCWGFNDKGQLGDNSIVNKETPVFVLNDFLNPIENVKEVSAGGSHNCVLLNDESVYCWGFNNFTKGYLGISNTTLDYKPKVVTSSSTYSSFSGAKKIVVGGTFSCAVIDQTEISIECWGDNIFGQLGNGSSTDSPFPSLVSAYDSSHILKSSFAKVSGLSLSYNTACANIDFVDEPDSGMQHMCWGFNNVGQLGQDSFSNVLHPNSINSLSGFSNFINGNNHTCGIYPNGNIKCWGDNSSGQLGLENTTNYGDSLGGNMINLIDKKVRLGF